MKIKLFIISCLGLLSMSISSCSQEKPMTDQEITEAKTEQSDNECFALSEDVSLPYEYLQSLKPEDLAYYRSYWTMLQHIELNGYEYVFDITQEEAAKLNVTAEHFTRIKNLFDEMTEEYYAAEKKGAIVYPFDPEVFVKNIKEKFSNKNKQK